MTEYAPAIAVPAEDPKTPIELETAKKRRFKAALMGGSLVLGAVGGFVEWRYGRFISAWPPPAHSLKHVPVGVLTAAAVEKASEKFDKRAGPLTVAGATLATNSLTETMQQVCLDDPHHPLAWTDHYGKGDNSDDLATSELSALAYYAANNEILANWLSVYTHHYSSKVGRGITNLASKFNQ